VENVRLMLLQTNSYVVPREKLPEHARLMRRFRQTMARLGCDCFDVFEQVGPGWSPLKTGGRFIQMIRFRDRKHHQQIQLAERGDAAAQTLIKEFCDLIDFPYQQEQGLFASGFYTSVLTPAITGLNDAATPASGTAPELTSEPDVAPPEMPARDFTHADAPHPNHNAGNAKPR
jgi:hypothetical protein